MGNQIMAGAKARTPCVSQVPIQITGVVGRVGKWADREKLGRALHEHQLARKERREINRYGPTPGNYTPRREKKSEYIERKGKEIKLI